MMNLSWKVRYKSVSYYGILSQWAFGVTCWEVFTCGQVPYRGINAMSLMRTLRNGERLDKPNNSACSQEMSVNYRYFTMQTKIIMKSTVT